MTLQEQLDKEQLDLYLLTHGLPKSQRTPPPKPKLRESMPFKAQEQTASLRYIRRRQGNVPKNMPDQMASLRYIRRTRTFVPVPDQVASLRYLRRERATPPEQTASLRYMRRTQTSLPSQELVRVEYPELKGDEPERFMVENVMAWTEAGFPEYGKVYTFPFGTGMPEGWRTKSVALAPYGKGNELIWTIEQFATYELTPESQAALTASQDFYAKIGFPQFGGAYAPFDVPSGFKVTGVKETFAFPEGGGPLGSSLAVLFESISPQPATPTTKDVFVPSGFGMGSAIWVSEATGEHFMRVGDEWVKMEQGFGPSPQELAAMLKPSAISAIALPVNIPKLAVFATVGVGIGEAYKYGTSGQHLTVEEIIGDASVGELVGLVGLNLVVPKVQSRASDWLMQSYEEQIESGVKLPSWSFSQKVLMKITGAKPQLPYGEIGISVTETMSKAGFVSRVPIGDEFTDIGWELTNAPHMGGVMLTKVPTVTTPRSLELFFGIGEELIPWNVIKGEGEQLGFEQKLVKPQDSYYPKIGSFDRSLKFVNVRTLMEENKLLPFTTQTQLTRMGIFPYVPDMNLGLTASKSLASVSASLLGLGAAFLPKTRQSTTSYVVPRSLLSLVSFPKLVSIPKLRTPTFEEPFEIQRLRMFPKLYPTQRQRKRAVLALTPMVSLEPLTETSSVSALRLDVPQLTEQVQKQRQSLAMPTFSLPKQTLSFPTFSKIPSIREPSFKGLGKGLFGKWFQRSHPIPTEKQIMRELGFGTGRKKGRGKRRHKQHKRAKR